MQNWKIYVGAVVIYGVYLLVAHFMNPMKPFRPSTVPAAGTVFVRGAPLAGVRVVYHPQFNVGKVKFAPNGISDAEGKFTLSSGTPGDGAPPGDYIVTFDFPQLTSGGIEEEIDLFEGKYSNPGTSPWKVTVHKDSQEFFQLN